jgi:LysM repeat protein
VCIVAVLLLTAATPVRARAQASKAQRPTTPAQAGAETDQPGADDYIVYQVRSGEDPSKVAHMFHITVEELLALNHITDPHRLSVGATLKIPDPRATRLAKLQREKDELQQQLTTTQATIGDLQKTIGTLEADVSSLREANEKLTREQTFYPLWRAAVFICAAAALVAAVALLVMWAKARDETRRRHLAIKEAELLHIAVEKHRQLNAQFELKYQNLFHGLPPGVQDRAEALRRAYDEDRNRLDAIVAEAERAIKRAAAALAAEPEGKRGKASVVRLSAARKSG